MEALRRGHRTPLVKAIVYERGSDHIRFVGVVTVHDHEIANAPEKPTRKPCYVNTVSTKSIAVHERGSYRAVIVGVAIVRRCPRNNPRSRTPPRHYCLVYRLRRLRKANMEALRRAPRLRSQWCHLEHERGNNSCSPVHEIAPSLCCCLKYTTMPQCMSAGLDRSDPLSEYPSDGVARADVMSEATLD